MQYEKLLIQACKNRQKGIVLSFLKKEGIDINYSDVDGYTALCHACTVGSRDIIKILIENGADVCVMTNQGEIRKRWRSNRSGSVTVTEFLSCFKDEEELIPAVEKLLEGRNLSRYNSVILVYDYEYLGKVSTDDKTDYMGCVYI